MGAKDGMYYVQRDINPCTIPESLWRAELLLFHKASHNPAVVLSWQVGGTHSTSRLSEHPLEKPKKH
jgi:hypothetical protein